MSVDPPMVSMRKELIHLDRYANVSLECHVFARPFARIFWQKNGQIIDEHRISHTRINQTMSTSRLFIQVNEMINEERERGMFLNR